MVALNQRTAEIQYGKTSKTVVTNPWTISFNWKIINFRIFPHYLYSLSLWQSDRQKKLNNFVMIDTVLLSGGVSLSDWDHVPLEEPKD
jgi:hypothetical protein